MCARAGRWRSVTAVWLFLRAESRRRWRAWLSLALIAGVFAGGVMTAAAGALRTGSAYARLLDWSRAPDTVVFADPYVDSFARLPPAAVMRVPQATDAAVIKNFNVTPGIIQLFVPATDAIPGSFWNRKILSGRVADPDRPGDLNISFTLAERFHLQPGDPLRLVLHTADGRPRPFAFRVAGIDAAQMEFPPQPGNGTYVAWGTPAFYRQHQSLDGFAQVALRLRHGSADWPAAQRELAKHADGKLVQAALLSDQSVNTERSIRPQAVALWLLAVLFWVIGLLITGQLLARQSFIEAAGYGTLRALGMTRAQLMAACLGRAAAIGAAGGLIGAMLAVALSPLLPVGLARVAEPHPGIDANVPVLAAGLAAAIVLTAACAAWPGWRAAAEGPLARLAGSSPPPRRSAAFRLAAARPDGGTGPQRDRERDRGRGRALRRHRLRRQPQPPARLARLVRGDLGCHSEQRGRERRPLDRGHGQARPADRGVDHLLDRGTIARQRHRLRGDSAPTSRRHAVRSRAGDRPPAPDQPGDRARHEDVAGAARPARHHHRDLTGQHPAPADDHRRDHRVSQPQRQARPGHRRRADPRRPASPAAGQGAIPAAR
jgi:hypothetical protein